MRVFYRYRSMFASGYDDWEYAEVMMSPREDKAAWFKERASELGEEYNWSEHYRRTDIEEVEMPPVEWLEEQVKMARGRVAYYTTLATEFTALVEKAKKSPETPAC